jgi:hypothetical protein
MKRQLPMHMGLDNSLLGREPVHASARPPACAIFEQEDIPASHKSSRPPELSGLDVPVWTVMGPLEARVVAGKFLGSQDAIDEAPPAGATQDAVYAGDVAYICADVDGERKGAEFGGHEFVLLCVCIVNWTCGLVGRDAS